MSEAVDSQSNLTQSFDNTSQAQAPTQQIPAEEIVCGGLEESSLYVNAKQFHRILKRRVARQKLEKQLRLASKDGKPSLHDSRGSHDLELPTVPGGRFLDTDKDSSVDQMVWPDDCPFFNPYTMDAKFLHSLLSDDSSYISGKETARIETRLGCVSLDETEIGANCRLMYSPSSEAFSRWLSNTDPTVKIAYVGVKRMYFHMATRNAIKITRQDWMQLLGSLEILPSALELLHDNNGGFSSHLSFHFPPTNSSFIQKDVAVWAYHISLKLGDSWPNHEHFFYARHDFHRKRDVVLIAGTESRKLCGQLCERLFAVTRHDIFSTLIFMLSIWLNQAEDSRWTLDYQVQDIESRTGFSSMQYRRYEPLTPEQLSLTKDMAQTAESIALLVTYVENMIKSISFAKEQHLRYYDICQKQILFYNPPCPVSQLQDTLAQYHAQACSKKLQMQMLQARVAAQIAVTNSLIAHRDSSVNIELAKAMEADSKLMRGIAFVTMIFLPATFLATFFSMTFFHLGGSDGNLTFEVSRWIWLYPLCTVPLTLVLAFQYGLDVKLRKVLQAMLTRLRSHVPGAVGDSEAQVPYVHREDQDALEDWADGFVITPERK